jgi:hypothetical protein
LEQDDIDEIKTSLKQLIDVNERILAALTKPVHPVKRVLDIAGSASVIGGILSAIDLVKGWFGG